MNGEISIQNGDFSILNGEEWIICVFFVYFRSARPKKILKNHLHSKKINKRFSTTFEVKNASFFEKTDAKRFSKKSEWRFLHSEWRFLRSNFWEAFSTFFWTLSVNCVPETFLHSEWRNLHSEWRNLHSLLLKSVFTIFLQNMKLQMKNASQQNKCRFLHSEWRFLHSIFFRSVLNFLLKKNRYRYFSPFKIEKSPFWMEISPFKCFSETFLIFFWKKHLQGIVSINFFQKRFDFLLKNKLHK